MCSTKLTKQIANVYFKCEIKHTKLNEALEAKLITCILLYITTKAMKNSSLKHIHIIRTMTRALLTWYKSEGKDKLSKCRSTKEKSAVWETFALQLSEQQSEM